MNVLQTYMQFVRPKNTILFCKTRWGKPAYLKKTRAGSYKFACIEADGTDKNIVAAGPKIT